MGTSNFHNENAQNIYVIDYGNDEFLWQDCQELIGEDIKSLDKSFEICNSLKSIEELRSYPSSSIGFWNFELTYLGITFELQINLFIRSGYYEAANLDYEFKWFINGDDVYNNLIGVQDVMNELTEELEYYDINPGIFTIHKNNLEFKLNDLENTAVTHVESVLKQISTPYIVTARFSNGETIYQKIGD